MIIFKGKKYCIKGKSKYFKEKYGTFNPEIIIEDTDKNVFGGSWMFQQGNPACLVFAMRTGLEGVTYDGKVFYGKIDGLGELVYEKELEEVNNEKGISY